MPLHPDIRAYNRALSGSTEHAGGRRSSKRGDDRRMGDALAKVIDQHLSSVPGCECKIWHRHPVWFIDGNPIVGYHKLKAPAPGGCIRLLFWSGRSFKEPGLKPEGGFKTAGARFTTLDDVKTVAKNGDLQRWLDKSIDIQWDYKNIVKRKGKLVRLK